jgi:hypothetical protein
MSARRDIAPAVAKLIATGEADPNTRSPIKDINPSFAPRVVKPLPFKLHDLNSSEPRGKKGEKPNAASILNFLSA